MSSRVATHPTDAQIVLDLVDGTRQPFPASRPVFITVADGNRRTLVQRWMQGPVVRITDLPVVGNATDLYTALAYVTGYRQSGFYPIRVAADQLRYAHLMLIPREPAFGFAAARWDRLAATHPTLLHLLRAGAADESAARRRYNDLLENRPAALAGLLNITTAMEQLFLPNGAVALSYCRGLEWSTATIRQDRFFGHAGLALLNQVEVGARQGMFEPELHPEVLHPGATRSWKQVRFGEANVQLTFHENDPSPAGQVRIECDMDYYRDAAAHALLEVVPNALSGSRTDPRRVYALRWIAGRQAGGPEFAPPYVLT